MQNTRTPTALRITRRYALIVVCQIRGSLVRVAALRIAEKNIHVPKSGAKWRVVVRDLGADVVEVPVGETEECKLLHALRILAKIRGGRLYEAEGVRARWGLEVRRQRCVGGECRMQRGSDIALACSAVACMSHVSV